MRPKKTSHKIDDKSRWSLTITLVPPSSSKDGWLLHQVVMMAMGWVLKVSTCLKSPSLISHLSRCEVGIVEGCWTGRRKVREVAFVGSDTSSYN